MNSATWKKFESWCAWFIHGLRYHANTGGKIDVESDYAIAQCKYRSNLSHYELIQLAEEQAEIGKQKSKLGFVIHQIPPGRGKQSIPVVTMTCEMFDDYFCLRPGKEKKE